ncbi:MAG TPA: TonB-dependent receptor [Puia sp.]|jgi:iron complex outermembrane receptor protein
MKRMAGILIMLCFAYISNAQSTLIAVIQDARTKEALSGATAQLRGSVENGSGIAPVSAVADGNGMVLLRDIPDGRQTLYVRFVGYEERTQTITMPRLADTLYILLEPAGEEMGEVIVSSTRSNRSIQNIPTRVEILSHEELEEKGNMKPGDIRMMLNESTGIQTQQVSATSANSSIRIQGLDGRYTQILKDGFPLYAGFSGGLGLLQTPPLDLKQVEIIKGSSSTLYGGGAIAGMVNLISQTPTPERNLRLLGNGTSGGGLDLSGFYGQRFGKIGLTLFVTRNSNKAYDPSGSIPFTAIPKFDRYVFNPKLFLYFSPRTKLNFGINTAFENRLGGDINYIDGHGDSTHSYYEKNRTRRLSTQFDLDHQFDDNNSLTIKNSVSSFNRTITIPGYVFDGKQRSTYSEIAYNHKEKDMDWVAGLNVYTDDFKENPRDTFSKRDYTQTTGGAFIQNTWKANDRLQIETGLRGDYVADYSWVVLPRISGLYKITPRFSTRLGGGLGYKTPTIFTEETEKIQFQSVLPISPQNNQLERSYGASFDLNYRTTLLHTVSLSVNQLFFFTRINHPLLLDTLPGNIYRLDNNSGYIDSKGFETNVKISYQDFKLYLGYTFTDAHLDENGVIRENPLTARHRLNNVLVYEKEDQWKIGFEAYYYSTQPLTDGTIGRAYWTFGFMAEKIWERLSLFINFENFTDTRQTRFDSIYTGTITHPVFKDIYAPLDGFVVNGGFRIKL